MNRLAIITSHPIQYHAPLFKLLTERGKLDVKVYYTWGIDVLKNKYDPGFKKVIEWDVPLLEGYEYEWVKNVSRNPGSHHFMGIITPDLNKQVSDFNPDAILVFGWNFHGHLQLLRHFHGKVNILFRGDSTLLNQANTLRSTIRYLLLKWVYRHVDKALFVGKANKQYYMKYGLKESQLVFAPHAVDIKRFSYTKAYEEDGRNIRSQLGIAQDAIVFLFAGKLETNKNPELLIQAFKTLSISKAHLVVVGNGSLEGTLKKMAAKDTNISFLEFQNQSRMPSIYHMCDIYVLPSVSETWGLAVNEAMASGKAILVSDKCGCASDLVRNGINGYIFKSGSVKSLAKNAARLASKQLAVDFGRQSDKIIRAYSYEYICKAIECSI